MAQLRTTDEFSSLITADLTWRIREISDLRTAIRRVDQSFRRSVLRASVPLLYAHWEGHVIVVARSYVEFLAIRRLDYSTLKPNFRLNEFFADFRQLSHSPMSYQEKIRFLVRVADSGKLKFRRVDEEVISSRSNLNSAVLKDLCTYLSLDHGNFEEDYDFIDKVLLSRRNNIAHGEYMEIDEHMFEEMSSRVIGVMRKFNNLAENDVVLGQYNVIPIRPTSGTS